MGQDDAETVELHDSASPISFSQDFVLRALESHYGDFSRGTIGPDLHFQKSLLPCGV